MGTLTERLAEFTAKLTYSRIPDDARNAAKRFVFDSVGCALGGLKQEDPEIYDLIDHFDELDDMHPFFDAIRIK
jgi:2-methylcitrate dehydratase PrpD